MHNKVFWFVVGSQFLYGPEVLETVDKRAAEMAETMSAAGILPCKLVYKATVKTDAEITAIMKENPSPTRNFTSASKTALCL